MHAHDRLLHLQRYIITRHTIEVPSDGLLAVRFPRYYTHSIHMCSIVLLAGVPLQHLCDDMPSDEGQNDRRGLQPAVLRLPLHPAVQHP